MSQSRRLPPKKDRKAFGKKNGMWICVCVRGQDTNRGIYGEGCKLWGPLTYSKRFVEDLVRIAVRRVGWQHGTSSNIKTPFATCKPSCESFLTLPIQSNTLPCLHKHLRHPSFIFASQSLVPRHSVPRSLTAKEGRSIIHHHVPSASRVIARDMVWHDEAPNTSLLVMSYYLSCTMQVVLFHGVNLNQIFVVYRCVQLVFLSYHLDSVALKYHFRFHFVASFRLSEIGGQVKAQTTAGSGGGDDRWRASNWHCQLSN